MPLNQTPSFNFNFGGIAAVQNQIAAAAAAAVVKANSVDPSQLISGADYFRRLGFSSSVTSKPTPRPTFFNAISLTTTTQSATTTTTTTTTSGFTFVPTLSPTELGVTTFAPTPMPAQVQPGTPLPPLPAPSNSPTNVVVQNKSTTTTKPNGTSEEFSTTFGAIFNNNSNDTTTTAVAFTPTNQTVLGSNATTTGGPTGSNSTTQIFGNTTRNTTHTPTAKPTDEPTTTTTTTTLSAQTNASDGNITVNISNGTGAPTPSLGLTTQPTAAPTQSPSRINVSSFNDLNNKTHNFTDANFSNGSNYSNTTTFKPNNNTTVINNYTNWTKAPSNAPSNAPSRAPTNWTLTNIPTAAPSAEQTFDPSGRPTSLPSGGPTGAPTITQTFKPTSGAHIIVPSLSPSDAPSDSPTQIKVTFSPMQAPTTTTTTDNGTTTVTTTIRPPTLEPTSGPSVAPTGAPTNSTVVISNNTNPANFSNATLSSVNGTGTLNVSTAAAAPGSSGQPGFNWADPLKGVPWWQIALGLAGLAVTSGLLGLQCRYQGWLVRGRIDRLEDLAEQGRLDQLQATNLAGSYTNRWFNMLVRSDEPLDRVLERLVESQARTIAARNADLRAQSQLSSVVPSQPSATALLQPPPAILGRPQPVPVAQPGIDAAPPDPRDPTDGWTIWRPPAITRTSTGFAVGPTIPLRRLVSTEDVDFTQAYQIKTQDTRIVNLWGCLVKAQQLPYSDAGKAKALVVAQIELAKITDEGIVDTADFETLRDILAPRLMNELIGLDLYLAQLTNDSRLAGTQNLNVLKLSSNNFSWDFNFIPNGGYYSGVNVSDRYAYLKLMNNNPFYNNHNGDRSKIYSVFLDSVNSQYIGSESNEIITIGGLKTTTYNVVAMGGDDVIRVSSESLRNGSVVNIFGGYGKNTYLISVDDSWSPLSSTIHIWDFDPSQDTIIFASTNGVNPNIKETKRTLFNSTFNTYQILGNGDLSFEKTSPQSNWNGVINKYHNWYVNDFAAAQHVLMGEGVPTIVLDETNYNPNNPDRLFNANALKWTPTQDIGDSIAQGNTSSIRVSTNINTQFSQLDSNSDHDLFKVHLSSGYSYVFNMKRQPMIAGSAALDTSLVLKDKNGSLIANNFIKSTKTNGDSLIEYVAVEDGDFYLDASGSVQGGLTPVNGKYAISAVEIPHNNNDFLATWDNVSTLVGGVFDGISNHVGYKVSLSAGDYVNLKITLTNGSGEFPGLSIFNNDGRVYPFEVVTRNLTRTKFLAQKTGDYFIEATMDNPSTGKTQFELFSRLNDIEGSKFTNADLSINTVVTSYLFGMQDHDWFRVSLDANKKYQFDLRKKSPGQDLDTFLRVRDSNGYQLAYDDDSGGSNNSRLLYKPLTSGNYYIDAASWNEGSSGEYTLSYKVI